jgi:xylose isomerase
MPIQSLVSISTPRFGGLATIADALIRVASIIEDGRIDDFCAERFIEWHGELG